MAVSPPFVIDETSPNVNDNISAYPADEQLNRDVIESWLTFISNPTTGLLKTTAFPSPFPIAGVNYTSYSGTPISTLVPGSTAGGLIEGVASAHLVVGIRNNDGSDSFSIVSTTDTGNSAYTRLVAQFLANENWVIGGLDFYRDVNDSRLRISGGSGSLVGADIQLMGGTEATLANQMFLDASQHNFRDKSSTTLLQIISGVVRGPDGSAAAPGFGFISDTNTGMYRITTDQIGFTTGGTLALSILSGGQILAAADVRAGNGVFARSSAGTLTLRPDAGSTTGQTTINSAGVVTTSGFDINLANGVSGTTARLRYTNAGVTDRFAIRDDTLGADVLRFNTSGNATFSGTITSGSINSSGTLTGVNIVGSGSLTVNGITNTGDVQTSGAFTDTGTAILASNTQSVILRPNGAGSSSGQLIVATSGNTTINGTLTVTG